MWDKGMHHCFYFFFSRPQHHQHHHHHSRRGKRAEGDLSVHPSRAHCSFVTATYPHRAAVTVAPYCTVRQKNKAAASMPPPQCPRFRGCEGESNNCRDNRTNRIQQPLDGTSTNTAADWQIDATFLFCFVLSSRRTRSNPTKRNNNNPPFLPPRARDDGIRLAFGGSMGGFGLGVRADGSNSGVRNRHISISHRGDTPTILNLVQTNGGEKRGTGRG